MVVLGLATLGLTETVIAGIAMLVEMAVFYGSLYYDTKTREPEKGFWAVIWATLKKSWPAEVTEFSVQGGLVVCLPRMFAISAQETLAYSSLTASASFYLVYEAAPWLLARLASRREKRAATKRPSSPILSLREFFCYLN